MSLGRPLLGLGGLLVVVPLAIARRPVARADDPSTRTAVSSGSLAVAAVHPTIAA